MKTDTISADSIAVPDFVERPYDKVKDDLLRRSIEPPKGHIQQPLSVLSHNGQLYLIDGLRRLRIAKALSIPKVPVVYDSLPDGIELNDYIRRMRFILNEKRQDLTPLQKAELVEHVKKVYGMTHQDVARFLGVSPDSITNWVSIRQYIPIIQEAVDRGVITSHAARVFDGLTEKGQKAIWKSHASELQTESGSAIHHRLRRDYSPESHPEFYRNAEQTRGRMERFSGTKRTGKKRPAITPAEKKRLMSSFEMKEIELKDSQEELTRLKREIQAAIAPIAAIMRNPDLWARVPDEMKPEIERWAEIYV